MPYRWHIRLAVSVGVLCSILVLSTSAKQIEFLINVFPKKSSATVEEQATKKTSDGPAITISSARNLFGRYQSQSTIAKKSKLRLNGIIMSDNPDDRFAIISEKGKSEGIFGLGDKINGGAIVKEIKSDRIIISRDGQRETLLLNLDSETEGKLKKHIPSKTKTKSSRTRRLRGFEGDGSGDTIKSFRGLDRFDFDELKGLTVP